MIRRQPTSTPTYTFLPYSTLFRVGRGHAVGPRLFGAGAVGRPALRGSAGEGLRSVAEGDQVAELVGQDGTHDGRSGVDVALADLDGAAGGGPGHVSGDDLEAHGDGRPPGGGDRKSTRLKSSH